ncbi:MAG: hypothetical protein WD767_08820 [Alphaproteobacteria bacterium]
MALETVSSVRSHGGTQGVYRHASAATDRSLLSVPDAPKRRPAAPPAASAAAAAGRPLRLDDLFDFD